MKKTSMTPRERVLATVQGKPVDQVPVFYYLNPHATCRLLSEFQPGKDRMQNFIGRKLWKYFTHKPFWLSDVRRRGYPLLMTFYGLSEYCLELGADIANVHCWSKDFWYQKPRMENNTMFCSDAMGNIRSLGDGIYLDIRDYAIKTIQDAISYEFPDLIADKNFTLLRTYRKKHPDAFIVSEAFGVQDLLATQMWGMTNFMMAMMDYPDDVKKFQTRVADWQIAFMRKCIRNGADAIFLMEDYGYTNSLLISLDMWREFTYPHLKRIIDAIHEEGALCMLHSCGYQKPLLKYYVEAGLDILQSLQPMAGNNFQEAYREVGDRLTFVTGIDTQKGERLTAKELRDDILAAYKTGGRNGRHILGMTHMLQHTMPKENIEVIFRTVREIQQGLHD